MTTAAVVLDKRWAEEVTASIVRAGDEYMTALLEAHDGRAWKLLGYKSFEDWGKERLGLGRASTYNELDRARAVKLLADVAGIKAEPTIRQARALRRGGSESVQHVRQLVSAGESVEDAIEHVTVEREKPITRAHFDDGYGSAFAQDDEPSGGFRCPKCGYTAPVVDEWGSI